MTLYWTAGNCVCVILCIAQANFILHEIVYMWDLTEKITTVRFRVGVFTVTVNNWSCSNLCQENSVNECDPGCVEILLKRVPFLGSVKEPHLHLFKWKSKLDLGKAPTVSSFTIVTWLSPACEVDTLHLAQSLFLPCSIHRIHLGLGGLGWLGSSELYSRAFCFDLRPPLTLLWPLISSFRSLISDLWRRKVT